MKKLLEGVRVLDFGWVATGPLTATALGQHGAEVIKIESASRADNIQAARAASRDKTGMNLNRGYSYYQFNTNKLDVTINLRHPQGVEIARRLVAVSDVVIENLAANVFTRMGLGYEVLRELKPDIIMLSSSVQGQEGPYALTRGWGTTTSSLAGICEIAGYPDRGPANLGVYTDWPSYRLCTLLILAALEYRRRTGKGMFIDHSQLESGMHFMSPLVLDYQANGRTAKRMANRVSYAAPHGAFRCRGEDRWCTIAIFTDEEWQAFCKAIGKPEWVKDTRFSTQLARKRNEDELEKLVEEWTTEHSAEEVMDMLQTAKVPAGVVQTGEDLLEHDPQIRHRHFICELEGHVNEIGKYYNLQTAFQLSKTPCEVRHGPLLGEHNEYVLKEILGMSDDEVNDLIKAGVLE